MPGLYWLRDCFLVIPGIFLAACASAPIAHQEEATQVVWRNTYRESHDPPNVQWRTDLTCYVDPTTGADEGFMGSNTYGGPSNGHCDAGLTFTDLDLCEVALYPPEPNFVFSGPASAFAHELLHMHLYYATGDGDAGHTRPEWQPGGLLDQANAALKAAGL